MEGVYMFSDGTIAGESATHWDKVSGWEVGVESLAATLALSYCLLIYVGI